MTILDGDIKLLKSQVMADVPEGGGRATGTVIVDGSSNSIFTDISELDRTYGRVNLMKTFVSVSTPDTDGYFGANVIISDPPDDPKVTCVLFTTNDGFDERASAAGRVESYLAQGSLNAALLFGNHIAGQMVVTLIQRESVALPVNGDTFVIRKNEGLFNEYSQYVRITDVGSIVRVFADENTPSLGEFRRTVVTIGISDALQEDFPGFTALRYDAGISFNAKSKVYNTVVADAARYYGAVPLTVAGEVGDVVVKGSDIFMQLVPSTRIEIPVADARMNQQSVSMSSTDTTIVQNFTCIFTPGQALYIGGGILPGSLSLTRNGLTMTDAGGILYIAGDQVGTADYPNGILTLATDSFGTSAGTHIVTYTLGKPVSLITASLGVPVTQQNQRLSWILSLDPAPLKNTLQISYRTLGKWYVLDEDGAGAVRGLDVAYGAGTLNYTTGTLTLTLGALPDVGSAIIAEWVPDKVVIPASSVVGGVTQPVKKFGWEGPLWIDPLNPGFGTAINAIASPFSLTWNDGVARTATLTTDGTFSGDATGSYLDSGQTYNHLVFYPNNLPAKNTVITANYRKSVTGNVESTLTLTSDGASWAGVVAGSGAITPNTFSMTLAWTYPKQTYPAGAEVMHTELIQVHDDGTTNLRCTDAGGTVSVNGLGSLSIGNINYTTGAISIHKTLSVSTNQPAFYLQVYSPSVTGYTPSGTETKNNTFTILDTIAGTETQSPWWAWWTGGLGTAIRATCNRDASFTDLTTTFTFNEIRSLGNSSRVMLGSTLYQLGVGGNYFRDISPTTGAGTVAGYTDNSKASYGAEADAVFTTWIAGTPSTATLFAGTTTPVVTGSGMSSLLEAVTFRTAIAPISSGGFTISGKWADGTTFNATSDVNGDIVTATAGAKGTIGHIDYDSGVVTMRFGFKTGTLGAAGVQDLTYMLIPGVSTITSTGVQSDSLRYSAVGYSYIPLDATILGLNPVRLPANGKVPIFRKGGVVVIHNEQTVAAQTVSNAQTVNVGRTRLSQIRVLGANNSHITTGYTTDLDAGTITFTSVAGYSQPVRVVHRIEDMALVTDAQINGQLTLNRQLTHDFPTLGSYISSALIIGDMQSRIPVFFDQYTWTVDSWLDSRVGNAATGTYNDVLAPLIVTNAGAITERWIIQFTNTTAFNIIGENSGVIGTGNTASLCAPNNPATGSPYFSIAAVGWGAGWTAGNILRFNTIGSLFPVWVMRTIQQGPPTAIDDAFTILIRGDIDRP